MEELILVAVNSLKNFNIALVPLENDTGVKFC